MDDICDQINSICDSDLELFTNLNLISSILFYQLDQITWAGVYKIAKNGLELVAFVGRVPCLRIPEGRGVVGYTAQEDKVVIVDDVDKFKGHIVCDSSARSEVCVPIRSKGRVWGVLDLDSGVESRFRGMGEEMEILGKCLSQIVEKSIY
jgi:GAF domain-containing protein